MGAETLRIAAATWLRSMEHVHRDALRPPLARIGGAEEHEGRYADHAGEMTDPGVVAEISRRTDQHRGHTIERLVT